MELRHRKGVLAVDHVDRLEEHKEHVHLNRVVRQGPLQGALTVIGLLIPIIAIKVSLWPASSSEFWRCFPFAFRSASGPISEVLLNVFKRHNLMVGRERWFAYSINTFFSFLALASIPVLAPTSMRMDLKPCTLYLIFFGVVIGFLASFIESFWPKICYQLHFIESFDPPTQLNNSEECGWNPYAEDVTQSNHIFGHFLLAVRLVNLVLLTPLVEELFFRDYVFESLGGFSWLALFATAFLWACFGLRYKGEWIFRFFFGTALQMLLLGKPVSCGLVPAVTAHAIRNAVACVRSVRQGRWYYWNI